MNYKQLLNRKPELSLANLELHYENIGSAPSHRKAEIKMSKKRVETIGIWIGNGILITAILLARILQ